MVSLIEEGDFNILSLVEIFESKFDSNRIGQDLFSWMTDLFPINRSISGKGQVLSLNYIQDLVKDLKIKSFKSNEQAFDWTAPDIWNVNEAYIEDESGNRIVDFKDNNLHLVGYSIPVNELISREKLMEHLHSIEKIPHAIPYVTSYYRKNWGFCISHDQLKSLGKGPFHVVIDSNFESGHIYYGELIIKGSTKEEILLSTYICHPSLANDNLSGPVVLMGIIKWLMSIKNRKYTYRIIFIPETIGSIFYIKENFLKLKKFIKAGFVLTCLGDENNYSYLCSRNGNSLTDKISKKLLKDLGVQHTIYPYTKNGSDERQFCFPGLDLPIGSLMKSKYGEYVEYHNSLDNLDFVTQKGLEEGFNLISAALTMLETNRTYKIATYCEPQLGKRGLYPQSSELGSETIVRDQMNVIAYLDGTKDLVDVSEICQIPYFKTLEIINRLKEKKLITQI